MSKDYCEFTASDIVELENKVIDLQALNAELLAVLKRLQEAPCPDRYDERWTQAEAVTKKAEGRE